MLLKLARNETCLCGSDSEFSDCCLSRFEDVRRSIARDLGKRHPDIVVQADFVEVLSAACAIAGDDDETPLALEAALTAADRVLGLAFGGDRPSGERITMLQRSLADALRDNSGLREARFDPREFTRVLDEVLMRSGSKGQRRKAGEPGTNYPLDARTVARALRKLFRPGLAEDFALHIYWALRAKPGPQELDGILWGLVALSTPGMSHDNPFMVAVFQATLSELGAAREEMEALEGQLAKRPEERSEDEEREAGERFEAFIERHPLMAKAISDHVFDEISEGLGAVAGGKVVVRLPAWTMLGGLRFLARRAPSLLNPDGLAVSDRMSRDKKLMLGLELREVGLDEDWDAFVPAAQEQLRLACADRRLGRALRAALEELIEQLETDLLEANQVAFQVVYEHAIEHLLGTAPLPTGLSKDHPFRLDPSDLLREAKIRAYAKALERDGQAEAARHVEASLNRP